MLIRKIKRWMPPYLWPVLLSPYVMAVTMVLVHISAVFWGSIPAFVFMGLCGAFEIAALGFVLYAMRKTDRAEDAALRTLLVKCAQIPAYIFFFLVGVFGTLLGIWGVGFVVFAYLCDVWAIILTGLYSARSAVLSYRVGILTKKQSILIAIASFIFCIDVPVAVFAAYKASQDSVPMQRLLRFLKKNNE